MQELDIVVVGAGIGGLGSALALARAGNRVTLVERDDGPMPDNVEDAFEWDRRGAPQVRHPHVFLGLAQTILRDHFPDVLRTLSELGVEPAPLGPKERARLDEATIAVITADRDLRMLPCRRTTFEWVMRRAVLAQPGVELRVGQGVAGLELDSRADGTPRITGVTLEDGAMLSADVVVVTTGRRGDLPAWLAAHGLELAEAESDAGVVYFSRFYRSDDDESFGFRASLAAGIGAGVIGSDAGTYSVTAVVDRADKELRKHLSDSDRFDATMRLLPELDDVTATGGEPIHPVHWMTGLVNRTRSFTDDRGEPILVGLFACGDAHTCTNPAYGRGQSLALQQAVQLTEVLTDCSDLVAAGRVYESLAEETIVPWYRFSVLTDAMRAAAVARSGWEAGQDGFELGGLLNRDNPDPELIRIVMRVFNLLELPNVLIELMATARESADEQPPRPRDPRVKGPTRADLLAVGA
jgi:2-polyprenyl-6-methoxyphenol hydroxylase-like FAD-dependent oxidoreductase